MSQSIELVMTIATALAVTCWQTIRTIRVGHGWDMRLLGWDVPVHLVLGLLLWPFGHWVVRGDYGAIPAGAGLGCLASYATTWGMAWGHGYAQAMASLGDADFQDSEKASHHSE